MNSVLFTIGLSSNIHGDCLLLVSADDLMSMVIRFRIAWVNNSCIMPELSRHNPMIRSDTCTRRSQCHSLPDH